MKIPSKKEALEWVNKHFPTTIDYYNKYVEETKKPKLSFQEFLEKNERRDFEKWMKEFAKYLTNRLRPISLEEHFLSCAYQSMREEWKRERKNHINSSLHKPDLSYHLEIFLIKLSKGEIHGFHTDAGVNILKRYKKHAALVKTKSLYDWYNYNYSGYGHIHEYDYHVKCTTENRLSFFEWLYRDDERLSKIKNYLSDGRNPYTTVKCDICKKQDIAYNMIVNARFGYYRCRKCDNNEKELTGKEITKYIELGIGKIHFEPIKGGRFNHQLIIDLQEGGCLTLISQRQNDQSTVVAKYIDPEDIPKKWIRGETKEVYSHHLDLALIASKTRY